MIKRMAFVLALCVLVFNFTLKAQTLKGDPWIFQVYKEVYNRQPSAWELNIKNYNNGSWNNYGELKKYVLEYQQSLKDQGCSIACTKINNDKLTAGLVQNGKLLAASVISPSGGNVVAAGGGNVIAAGGGNVVASGGLNLTVSANTASLNFAPDRFVQSAGTKVIKLSGKGSLLIR